MRWLALLVVFVANAAVADNAPSAKPPESAAPPLTVWRPVGGGGLEHVQSGVVCPSRIDAYRRTDAAIFDRFGLDVGCNYSRSDAAVTLYLTRREPGGEGLDAAMAEAKKELLEAGAAHHPVVIAENRLSENGLDWTTVVYREDGEKHTAIWIADLSGWTFEFRATYPAADDLPMGALIGRIATQVRTTAGTHLALCARAP